MNTTSASLADAAAAPAAAASVRIWDAPVRVVHWLAVLCFAGAWLSAESERWRLLHVSLGYTLAGLVAFRIVWGLAGSRHARFASFVRGPAAVWRYLRSLPGAQPEHHVGHNPAGGWAILALLALALGATASGWACYEAGAAEWVAESHEALATAMLALVVLHVAAVALSSRLHRENLVGAMLTGRKRAPPQEGVARSGAGVAALVVAAVLGFWGWQAGQAGQIPPAGSGPEAGSTAAGDPPAPAGARPAARVGTDHDTDQADDD